MFCWGGGEVPKGPGILPKRPKKAPKRARGHRSGQILGGPSAPPAPHFRRPCLEGLGGGRAGPATRPLLSSSTQRCPQRDYFASPPRRRLLEGPDVILVDIDKSLHSRNNGLFRMPLFLRLHPRLRSLLPEGEITR